MTVTKIKYRPFPNITLSYTVKSYEIVDNLFIRFYDLKDKKTYSYPIVKCEIEETR